MFLYVYVYVYIYTRCYGNHRKIYHIYKLKEGSSRLDRDITGTKKPPIVSINWHCCRPNLLIHRRKCSRQKQRTSGVVSQRLLRWMQLSFVMLCYVMLLFHERGNPFSRGWYKWGMLKSLARTDLSQQSCNAAMTAPFS